ncbi:MAG: membrane protein insertion efficiency factor YidD [Xanthomonadaceae bacterium]|nr:membrane protein insertion efficiency factor YidD [Rhodospirillaceae bacterium]NIA18081.1 membrane protein insertion efficiency factor YidD [Xanthomonadaceae bacterium]
MSKQNLKNILFYLSFFPKKIILKLIRLYQKTLSFDHGLPKKFFPYGYCRFNPTCSEYGYQAIEKYGIIKGGLMALWRIIRCNPWNKGGNDPVK